MDISACPVRYARRCRSRGNAWLPNIGWPHSIVPDPSAGRSSEGPVGGRRRYLEQIRVLKAGSVCLYTYSWNWRIRPWLDLVGFVLLQVLDEGRLTDNKGRTADFRNAIIIMTSNIGSHLIKERFEQIDDMQEATDAAREDVMSLLKQTVRPEFLNRIDDIVMFSPLTRKDIRSIVKLQFKGIKKMLSQQQITLDATKQAIDFLAQKGFQPEYGARPVKRTIQREVLNQLSKELLSGRVTANSIILLDAFDGQLVFRNEDERTGEEE